MLNCKGVWRLDGDSQAPGMGVNASLKMEYLGSAVRKWSQLDNQIFLLVGARGFAHFVTGLLPVPASAPLRSLSQPSLAAFPTLSRRSLRFESS